MFHRWIFISLLLTLEIVVVRTILANSLSKAGEVNRHFNRLYYWLRRILFSSLFNISLLMIDSNTPFNELMKTLDTLPPLLNFRCKYAQLVIMAYVVQLCIH